jgi:thioester reductase-like protein
MALLLTGATGFVGMEVLSRFLERTDRRVFALVRAEDEEAAARRLRSTMTTLFGRGDAYAGRVVAVPGDIESDGLGLSEESRGELAGSVRDIIHCAASVSFSLPLEQSREINVAGTRRLLEFAELCRERGGLRRFAYVSTAYVAGTHAGEFREDQLEVGQEFRNAYERSKFEAERLVRSYRDRLPIQIFRPSIVVGDRRTGWTASFNVLYAPLKAFARGAYRALPVRRSAPVDVVPVDYVADAVFELSNRPVGEEEEEETYHLVAGRGASTVGRLMELSAGYFGRRPPRSLPPVLYRRLVHPLLVRRSSGRRRRALERSEAFFPYFSMRVRYDDRRAQRRLRRAGVRVTPIERYFDRLADFAERSRWGKVAVTRAQLERERSSSRALG